MRCPAVQQAQACSLTGPFSRPWRLTEALRPSACGTGLAEWGAALVCLAYAKGVLSRTHSCREGVAFLGLGGYKAVLTAAGCSQVGAQTETELKEKKLRVEDALNATKVCSCRLCLVNCTPA